MANSYKGLTGKLLSLCDSVGALWRRNRSAEQPPEERMFEESFLSRSSESPQQKTVLLRMKCGFARQCENSVLLRFFSGLLHRVLLLRARTVAAFLATYIAAAAAVSLSRSILFDILPSSADYLRFALLACVLIPLIFSDSTVYRLLEGSALFGGFFRFVHPSDALRDGHPTPASVGLFMVCGLLCGALTWFVGILSLPAALLVLLFCCLIFCFPEAGLLLILAFAPFFGLAERPSVNLAVAVLFTFLSLLFKVLRGKKNLHWSVEIIPFALLLGGVLLSGSSPYRGAFQAAVLTAVLLLGYFLTYNLFRNEKFQAAAATAIAVSASFVALFGIAQYVLGKAPAGWLDFSLFSAIPARTVSVFDNPNVLGAYLVIAFPFVLSRICSVHGTPMRIFGILGSVLVIVCGILTWSRACWIGLLVGLLVFAIRLSPRGLLLLPASALGITAAAFCLPDTFGKRLTHLFSLSDSANAYRVRVWNGTMQALRRCWFTGIGSGDYAFRAVYLQYAVGGAEAAPHSHSIYLQLAVSCGIVTLLTFLWFALQVLRKGGQGSPVSVPSDSPAVVSASFAAVIAMLLCGIVDNVFYNYRILFLFFCVCGLCSAAAETASDKPLILDNQPESAAVTVHLTKGGK